MNSNEISQQLSRIEEMLIGMRKQAVERAFYTTGEAAERLGLSKWYIRRLCATGEILAEKHPGSRRFLIPAEELHRIETRRGALED